MRVPTDLQSEFDRLRPPQTGDARPVFSGVLIEGLPHRVAVDPRGYPCVLLRMDDTTVPVGLRQKLQYISVTPSVMCRILHPDGDRNDERVTLIQCESSDPALQRFFLKVMDTLLLEVGSAPTLLQLTGAISRLVELFTLATQAPKKTVTGLWSELFLISQSRKPIMMLEAWHRENEEVFDFASADQLLEVKATSSNRRIHQFSSDQLDDADGRPILIASLTVRQSGAGVSIATLLGSIREQAGGRLDLVNKLDRIVASCLGTALADALEVTFDSVHAFDGLMYFRAADVPRLKPPFPPGVSSVHFTSDLSASPNFLPPNSAGGLMSAIPMGSRTANSDL